MASLPQHNKTPHKPSPFPLNVMRVMLPICCAELQWLGLGDREKGEQILRSLMVYLTPVSELTSSSKQGLCPELGCSNISFFREKPCSPWSQLGDFSMGEAANITGT